METVTLERLFAAYTALLQQELIRASGCTEPGAVAYAAAIAVRTLGCFPETIAVACSGNIVKNVKGVVVPNSGGLRGIDAAAVLGAVGGDASAGLEVLEHVSAEDCARTRELLATGFCTTSLVEHAESVYIDVRVTAKNDVARVVIRGGHTHVALIEHNGETVLRADAVPSSMPAADIVDDSLLTVRGILAFADSAEALALKPLIMRQLAANTAISEDGLRHGYGARIGQILMATPAPDVKTRAKAKAAAGADARMGGSAMPVVINSGSGNQGITVSIPVAEYAREFGADEDTLCRALIVSNLISIHLKRRIGKLSAFCGAVSAACGSGAAIAYLHHGSDYERVGATIINTLANVSGIVCDGAKASCAAKIASSLDAAIMGYEMADQNVMFGTGEGIVAGDVEATIDNIVHMAQAGMRETDNVIIQMMTTPRT